MKTKISEWGNSHGIRMTAPMLAHLNVEPGVELNITLTDKGIEIMKNAHSQEYVAAVARKTIDGLLETSEPVKTVDDAVNPLEVAALFENENVSYALIGGHMQSYYTGTARATVDVDFIIGGVDFERATKLIHKTYIQFKHHNQVYHVTYNTQKTHKDPERIDLVKDGFPLFKAVVQKYYVTLRAKKQVVKIPTIEAAIALKFAAAISPNRSDENKPIDNTDLMRLVRAEPNLNKQALLALGEPIYSGGGKELTAVVSDIKQGKTISL